MCAGYRSRLRMYAGYRSRLRMNAGYRPRLVIKTRIAPDPLHVRIWRDDQDTVTVTAREDPSERAGKRRPRYFSLREWPLNHRP